MPAPSKDAKPVFRKFRLKEWLGMQAYLSTIRAAAKTQSPGLPDLIYRFLAAATDSNEEHWKRLYWELAVNGMVQIQQANEFAWKPPLALFPDEVEAAKSPWLYTGRDWYFWRHVFTEYYGWQEQYIADLEVEEAFALMQEIMTEEQMEKEWEYGLSEKSVSYDPKTKQGHFNPLPRPNWMRPATPVITKVRVKKSMLPEGVIDVSGMGDKLEVIE
jgi:hypothetical protein